LLFQQRLVPPYLTLFRKNNRVYIKERQ